MYSNLNIAVIGDIMLDHWREGSDYKLNPEAPTIDITNPTSEYTLGGAGNVAKIVAGLGARVTLFGVLGTTFSSEQTEENKQFDYLCSKLRIGRFAMLEENRRTTVKERIICDGQQICRIGEEDTHFIEHKTVSKLLERIDNPVIPDGIIIADYAKGLMHPALIDGIRHISRRYDIPVLVDPKDRLYIYKGCAIMKPNTREYETLVDPDLSNIGFFEKMQCKHLVVTSKKTINWYSEDMSKGHVHCHDVEVANVSGCGDTVAAVLLMEYIRNGHDIAEAVKLATWAASCVVQQERTGHLTLEDLAVPIPIA